MIDVFGFVSNLLTGFLQLVLDLIISLCNLLLLPIDAVIFTLIPDFADLTIYINRFLVYASTYLGYLLDMFGFYPETLILLVAFIAFKLTVPLQLWVAKVALKWYNILKL